MVPLSHVQLREGSTIMEFVHAVFKQGPLDYSVSFLVLVGYPEAYPGVYHVQFLIFFSCFTGLWLWLSHSW